MLPGESLCCVSFFSGGDLSRLLKGCLGVLRTAVQCSAERLLNSIWVNRERVWMLVFINDSPFVFESTSVTHSALLATRRHYYFREWMKSNIFVWWPIEWTFIIVHWVSKMCYILHMAALLWINRTDLVLVVSREVVFSSNQMAKFTMNTQLYKELITTGYPVGKWVAYNCRSKIYSDN